MSQIKVDTITDEAGTGAPDFPNGASVTGTVTATAFSGNGSSLTNLPAPTTSQALDATAGASVGAVGTYAFLQFNTAGAHTHGSTHSGANLRYSNAGASVPTVTNPSGTWRLMGDTNQFSNPASTSLFLRIS